MKRHRIVALAVTGVAASLVVGTLVIGSNMGFKKNQPLTAANQDQWVAVPFTGPYANADDLLNLVLGGDGTITRFIPGIPTGFDFWNGSSGNNFAFVPGEAYQFRPGSTSGGTSAIIVGAHDPNQTIPVGGFTTGVDYLVSPPYHTTATNADDLLADLPGLATVTRLIPGPTSAFDFWTGSAGYNFAYTIGDGVLIRPATSSAGYLPAHF
ncbi:MAG: hypothetical protein ACE5IK_00860 [Acidobacteriota bacterium]